MPPPNLILAMDTSGDVCSVALFRNGRFHAELAFRHEMHLSERLISHVDLLLTELSATLHDVDCFVVGTGPGSFTGTRIGVMTMKTFAFVQEKPIVAINGLEAMAAEYCGMPGVTVTPVLACRTGFVYACPFSVEGDYPAPLAEPNAFTFGELGEVLQRVDGGTLLFCGPAARRYEADLRASLGERGVAAAFGAVEFPRAASLGRLAILRLGFGAAAGSPLDVIPLYISPPPITLPKQPIPT